MIRDLDDWNSDVDGCPQIVWTDDAPPATKRCGMETPCPRHDPEVEIDDYF